MRYDNQFTYEEWVIPVTTEKSRHLNASFCWRKLDSHIGHAIKVKQAAYMYGPGAWKYRCSNLWYHEDDLVAKEDFKSLKVIGKMIEKADALGDLL